MKDRYCNFEILKYSNWQQASRILGLLGPFGLLRHSNNTVVLQLKCFCYFNGLLFTQIGKRVQKNLSNLTFRTNVKARRPLALLRGLKKWPLSHLFPYPLAYIERGVEIKLLFSYWDHTKPDMKYFMHSLTALTGLHLSRNNTIEAKFFKVYTEMFYQMMFFFHSNLNIKSLALY